MGSDSKILIVGGGFAGARAAQELSKKGFKDVTLVDRKSYFEVTYAALRGVTEPNNWGKRSRVAYTDFIEGKFVQAAVTELSDKAAQLDNGSTLSFDYAVVAMGSSYQSFEIAKSNDALNLEERGAEVSKHYQELAGAQSALVIGGGLVGVEFAGELADHFPNMKVTLVHSGEYLLDSLTEKAGLRAQKKLEELDVSVKLNTRLDQQEDGSYSAGDEVFSADLVYVCTGAKPNNAMLKANFGDCLNAEGRLKVSETLQVTGKPNIFAMGDIADVDELKVGYLADMQGAAVAKNLRLLLAGKKLKAYKTNPKMALVPVGRKSGLIQLPFAVTSLQFMLNMKQKDLFISKNFNTLGVDKKKWPQASES